MIFLSLEEWENCKKGGGRARNSPSTHRPSGQPLLGLLTVLRLCLLLIAHSVLILVVLIILIFLLILVLVLILISIVLLHDTLHPFFARLSAMIRFELR